MENILAIAALFCLLAVFAFTLRRKSVQAGRKWLPGPISLPILGSVLQIGYLSRKFQHFKVFEELCNRHGPVIGIQAGVQYMVIVEDHATAKSILTSDTWSDRIPARSPVYQLNTGGKNFGLMFSSGETWKENRKFVLTKLKESGFVDSKRMEVNLSEELEHFFKGFDMARDQNNDEVLMQGCFKLTALNIVWRALCGARLSENDPQVATFIEQVEAVLRAVQVGAQPDIAFPFLTAVPGLSTFHVLKGHHSKITAFFKGILKNRRAEGTYKFSQTNFMDAYLKKIDEVQDTPASQVYCDDQLILSCVDTFNAGADTTGSTLEFAVLYMIAFPEVQRQVQAEIDWVTLDNQNPVITLSDKEKMPYTEAVILETLRVGTIIPVIPRSNGAETTLNGCYVPKDSLLLVNCYKLNHDEKVWGDPERFRPERFLDPNGQVVKDSINKLLAFGAGRRLCTGITSAKASLFKILTALLQRYTLEPSLKRPLGPLGDFDTGINNTPKPFHCVAKLRKQVEI